VTARRQGEGVISDAIRARLAWEPGLVLFRNSAAVVKSRGRFYKGGLGNGSADLVGCLAGRFVALEVKVPGEEATKEQIEWAARVRAAGGFAAVVHGVEEAVAAVARARQGAAS
jgi:hypothetical protein